VKKKDRVDDSNFKSPDGVSSQFKTPGFGILDLTGSTKSPTTSPSTAASTT
jgi:hemoglobin/transferrin/lactoferrin receptor protein